MFDQTWGYLQHLFKFISRLLLKFVLLIMQLFLLLLLPSFKRFSDFFPWCDDIESLNHSFHWNSLFKTKNMCQLSDFFSIKCIIQTISSMKNYLWPHSSTFEAPINVFPQTSVFFVGPSENIKPRSHRAQLSFRRTRNSHDRVFTSYFFQIQKTS